MSRYDDTDIAKLLDAYSKASLKVYTLGQFKLVLNDEPIGDNWGRDKAVQLFQFFVISRNRTALHKEQIIDRLWEESGGDQDFKVALHGINKALSPNKKGRGNSKFILRQGSSYKMDMEQVWLDSQIMESFVEIGNESLASNKELSIMAYQSAVELYKGTFLPNRIYEDWTTTERERLQMLALGAYLSLSELLIDEQANESIRLTEEAINIDSTWEEAYRIQMRAHALKGNRVQAIKTFERCKSVLEKEYGLDPLPQTIQLLNQIKSIS